MRLSAECKWGEDRVRDLIEDGCENLESCCGETAAQKSYLQKINPAALCRKTWRWENLQLAKAYLENC